MFTEVVLPQHHWGDHSGGLVLAEAITELVGGVNLEPGDWFTEFATPYPPLPDRLRSMTTCGTFGR